MKKILISLLITVNFLSIAVIQNTFAQVVEAKKKNVDYLDSLRLPKKNNMRYEQVMIKQLQSLYNPETTEQGDKAFVKEYNQLFDVLTQVSAKNTSEIPKEYRFLLDAQRDTNKLPSPTSIGYDVTNLLANGYTLEQMKKIYQTKNINILREIREGSRFKYLVLLQSNIIIGTVDSIYADYSLADGFPTSYSVSVKETLKGNSNFTKVILRTREEIVTARNGFKYVEQLLSHARPTLQTGQTYLFFISKPDYERGIIDMETAVTNDSIFVTPDGGKSAFRNDSEIQEKRKNCFARSYEINLSRQVDSLTPDERNDMDLIQSIRANNSASIEIRKLCTQFKDIFQEIQATNIRLQKQ